MESFVVAALTLALTGATLAQAPGNGQRWSFGPGNTPGWALMSVEERIEHRNRIMSFRTSGECDLYVDDHRRQMQARAMDRGQILPAGPRSTVCGRLLRAGRLN